MTHVRRLMVDRDLLPIVADRIGLLPARHLLLDLARDNMGHEPRADALHRLATVLGSPAVPVVDEVDQWTNRLHYNAMLADGVHWSGDHLTLEHPIPDTLMLALVGMPLSSVVRHPLLPPDRIITIVKESGLGTVITVERDEESVHRIVGDASSRENRIRMRFRDLNRSARHMLGRGIPAGEIISLMALAFEMIIFTTVVVTAHTSTKYPLQIAGFASVCVAAAGYVMSRIMGNLMREGSENDVLRAYHMVRSCMTRDAIRQGLSVNPKTYAIL